MPLDQRYDWRRSPGKSDRKDERLSVRVAGSRPIVREAWEEKPVSWRCQLSGDDLVVTASGIPLGTAWQIELKDAHWLVPLVSTSDDSSLVMQLPRPGYDSDQAKRTLQVRACVSSTAGKNNRFEDTCCTDWSAWLPVPDGGAIDVPAPRSKDNEIAGHRDDLREAEAEIEALREELSMRPDVDEEVHAAFAQFDANNSGQLDYTELQPALKWVSEQWISDAPALKRLSEMSEQQTAIMLRRFDTDHSGLIELGEFANLVAEQRRIWVQTVGTEMKGLQKEVKDQAAELERRQKELDKAGKALKATPRVPEDVRRAFERYDREKKERIEYGDLRAALKARAQPCPAPETAARPGGAAAVLGQRAAASWSRPRPPPRGRSAASRSSSRTPSSWWRTTSTAARPVAKCRLHTSLVHPLRPVGLALARAAPRVRARHF
jgi:Ca2+-binding EF-hand superfamily protein